MEDRPKRRRSPSPSYPSTRPRHDSPPSRQHHQNQHHLPDPASVPGQLTYREFAEWFRVSHPQTAKADDEELRRIKAEDPDVMAREKIGMAKRYERYRKEYTSRQV
jgi:hypothetical protein